MSLTDISKGYVDEEGQGNPEYFIFDWLRLGVVTQYPFQRRWL